MSGQRSAVSGQRSAMMMAASFEAVLMNDKAILE